MVTEILKRDGRRDSYDESKIVRAVERAMRDTGRSDISSAASVGVRVSDALSAISHDGTASVDEVQDAVEQALAKAGWEDVARSFRLFRADRTRTREKNSQLMHVFDEITSRDSKESDLKRDNANVDGDSAMGTMLQYGATAAKEYNEKFLLRPEQARAYREGWIHIHDFDFYALTMTCCQIDLLKLFHGGFSTGHGFLREPNDIRSYAALACIAIQSNQNDQHGGQSIAQFDRGLAPGVAKTFAKRFRVDLAEALSLLAPEGAEVPDAARMKALFATAEARSGEKPRIGGSPLFDAALRADVLAAAPGLPEAALDKAVAYARKTAAGETDEATYQAMEALIHNLNTMHSRAGAQTPFSSINYGTDTSAEGRMIVRNLLLSTEKGLGRGETPIFPIQIFRVKDGVNYNPGDPNYDLFQLACRVSAKRLFPNFSFVDAPYNLQYYKPGHPETEVSYMGCRTRVLANVHDPDRAISPGRGNLSFTSINLPRLAIEAHGDEKKFFSGLDEMLALVAQQLLDRFEIQARRKVKNFPFLMGQGVWLDSDKLHWNDEVREVIKHGTLSIGFIGLAETLVSLYGRHHGESDEMQEKGLAIVRHIREFCDGMARKTKLNWTCLATPAEGLSGRFIRMDKKRYGIIPGVTEHEYYTNSFHVPVYYKISAIDKIRKEAPYHALTNAGHITYVELDGDMARNVKAFESVIRAMHDAGIGYGSVNHPVDRDPVCGYNGVIGDVCPKCGRRESDELIKFERIRRITGYLVGTLDRFNDAKRAEEHDRVKHGLSGDGGAGA
ncbi:MAG: anaerobic ribonucleoside triphosphate reductase [Kiritimatiellae bacterium]|nr:anaerobic ribonucleoside triphosphate reductase [Kiritimatiellia bacterium]MBR1835942.1 anaerobic ribonucleoside triphosphate reductase [Kiritimatiellia bacterium]